MVAVIAKPYRDNQVFVRHMRTNTCSVTVRPTNDHKWPWSLVIWSSLAIAMLACHSNAADPKNNSVDISQKATPSATSKPLEHKKKTESPPVKSPEAISAYEKGAVEDDQGEPETASTVSSRPAAASMEVPITLVELDESAYGISLAVDGQSVYLATSSAVYRYTPGAPPEKRPLDIGYGSAFTQDAIVFWSKGEIHTVAKAGGTPRPLGKVANRPMQIIATEKQVAWVDKDTDGKFTIQTLRKSKPKIIYTSKGNITSSVVLNRWVFFVERIKYGVWRFARVSLSGGSAVHHSVWHTGRVPSMLSASDHVYYYDLPSRSVRRVALNLKSETTVADKIVCSPIAVSDRVLCARVEGIFELSKQGGAFRVLTRKPVGLITAIAGSPKIVAWINDTGTANATIRMLALPP
jgi:hypothetical protein